MNVKANLFSEKTGELNKFLKSFYNVDLNLSNKLSWEKEYANPIELADLIGVFIDNIDDYIINMWICVDKNIFINISEKNANSIIKYLFERFPY